MPHTLVTEHPTYVQWIETTPIKLALPLYLQIYKTFFFYKKYLIFKTGVRDWCRLITNNFYHENNIIWGILTKSRNFIISKIRSYTVVNTIIASIESIESQHMHCTAEIIILLLITTCMFMHVYNLSHIFIASQFSQQI